MRVFLKLSFAVIVVMLFSGGASRGQSLLHDGVSFAIHSMPAYEVAQPQTEEPRGPNVFVWYCCNGVRFHSFTINPSESFGADLYWGVNYQSVAIRLPNCRGGKVSIKALTEGLEKQYHFVDYAVGGALINGATMANCDVVADLYQGNKVVNSQDFRVIIQE